MMKFLNIILITLILVEGYKAHFSCFNNSSLPLGPIQNKISGNWFEIMRSPDATVPACVDVNATIVNESDEFSLDVRYVDNVYGKWQPMEENIRFNWSNLATTGELNLVLNEDENKATVTFHLLELYQEEFPILCGTASNISPISLLKVLSRRKILAEEEQQNLLQHLQMKYAIKPNQVRFVYQGDDCNHGTRNLGSMAILTISLHLCQIIFKSISTY